MKRIMAGLVWFCAVSGVIIIALVLFSKINDLVGSFIRNDGQGQGRQTQNEETADKTKEINITEETEMINGVDEEIIELNCYNGDLELPVSGATGYASVDMDLIIVTDASTNEWEVVAKLKAGAAFVIVREEGDWWYVSVGGAGGMKGWVLHSLCMINLPDVVPSIIYNNTSAYSSGCRTSGESIPGITGEQMYSYSDRADGRAYNERLQKYEYIVPVLYSAAKRVRQTQQNALENGDSIVMYEAFRPYSTQKKSYEAILAFSNANPHIKANLSTPQWNISWFVASGISNHQRGYAVDASLAKVLIQEYAKTGSYHYKQITRADYYEMPTPIHELSIESIVYTRPVQIESLDAWRTAEYSEGMQNNLPARNLQKYFTDAGFTPLASEWWHFNDLHTLFGITNLCGGDFEIKDCFSIPPN